MRNRIAFLPDASEHTDPFLVLVEDWVGVEGGFPTHPHRGFETVTLVIEGSQEHRDSTGESGILKAGDVQWMTAGRGVLHSEMPRGGCGFHCVQLWVNLPAKEKMRPPRYQNLPAGEIPTVEKMGSIVRVIAGEHAGARGPAETMTPVNVFDVILADGARFERDATGRAIAYVIAGALDGHPDGSVVYLERGRHALTATGRTRVLWMEGERISEPVVAHGPFVMNTLEEIELAFRDLRAGKLGR
jgi:redox-sensitive bicupin YhaK (pirin superfamily)